MRYARRMAIVCRAGFASRGRAVVRAGGGTLSGPLRDPRSLGARYKRFWRRANASRPVQRPTHAATFGAGDRSRPASGAHEITDATFRSATLKAALRR